MRSQEPGGLAAEQPGTCHAWGQRRRSKPGANPTETTKTLEIIVWMSRITGLLELPTSKTETEIDPDEEGLLLIDSRVAAKNPGPPGSWILTPGSSLITDPLITYHPSLSPRVKFGGSLAGKDSSSASSSPSSRCRSLSSISSSGRFALMVFRSTKPRALRLQSVCVTRNHWMIR